MITPGPSNSCSIRQSLLLHRNESPPPVEHGDRADHAIDIVRNQIIAAGKPLDIRQEDVTLQGHAIQCRINAEDPKNNFMPCTGTVTAYLSPGGIGVRIDGAVYKDYTVPPYYDALLAKLTVREPGKKRSAACADRLKNTSCAV